MNIQAFNKESNKIRQSDEYGQILWEDIKYISPIIIIDEPQKIEGTAKKKSASLEAIEMINPLFILRYSATHKQLYNQVYKLDSYDAFKNDLVKKIEVKTVHGTIPKDYPYIRYVEFTSDLKAKLEIFCVEQGGIIRTQPVKVRGGDSLYEASGDWNNIKMYSFKKTRISLRSLK
jgi:type III restriction enzyme